VRHTPETQVRSRHPAALPHTPAWKLALLAAVPLLALFGSAELVVRATRLDRPALETVPFIEELDGLFRTDSLLFWSLRPGFARDWEGTHVHVNAAGLRTPEVAPRRPGELRILSLGESSSFGIGVDDDETYAAQLERLLGRRLARRVTVINAGVPAYSSFQSLLWLRHRGTALDPDVVLFYHELNDYLPSSLRDSSNNEIGVLKTDRELHASRLHWTHRTLFAWSALYRFASHRHALGRIRAVDRTRVRNPLGGIGLPDLGIAPRLVTRRHGGVVDAELNERSLGQRVSEPERWQNLEELAQLCRQEGILLLVIHPAYRESRPHECLLTRFCRERGVPMLEALDSLHPPGTRPGQLYVDSWHPGADGHRRLAHALARRLRAELLDGGTAR
jgi:hypothetical protein